MSYEPPHGFPGKITDFETTGGVWLHNFSEVANELGNGMTDWAMLYDERLWDAVCVGCRGCSALEMRPVFSFAGHQDQETKNIDLVTMTSFFRIKLI